jgi:hypothetical protein
MPKHRSTRPKQQLINDLTNFFRICAEHRHPRLAFKAAKKPGVWKILHSEEILYNDNSIIRQVRERAKKLSLWIDDRDLFGHFEGMVQTWPPDYLEELNSEFL